MRFHVLGPVRVANRGGQLSLGGRQQRLVLALLLVSHGRTVSTDSLVEDVWDGEPPSTARKTLQGYIHHLRRVIGDTIRSDGSGYRLDVGSAFFDARKFEEAVDKAMEADSPPSEVSENLAAALALWAGTPYADVDHALALRPEITRLSELRLGALEGRIEADIALGGGPDLIGELRSLIAEYPLREKFTGHLMHALYLAGRQTEAIRAYDRTREHLIEQVGLDPSPELTVLRDRILQHDPVLAVAADRSRSIHAIKGYELRETVTEDGDGRIDRAYQTAIGRQVTIKVIEAPLANETDFVAAFFDEASAVSRLAHPHLVPISDYWREPNRAYIVSPWFDGGSLAQRTLTASAFEQVASALAYAHRQRVAHGNITAEDIVFDADGNAYLGGFTIGHPPARRGEFAGTSRPAQTSYVTRVRSDIVGVTELLAEHGPDSWLSSSEMRDVIARGSAPDPDVGYARVEDLLRDFRRALGRDVTAMAGSRIGDRSDLRNPFKGLRAFQESDAADFFGRTDLIETVVEALDRDRFVTVVGASGSGKSSLVKAGVIPALKNAANANRSKLLVAEMYPGAYPFEELEGALLSQATSRSEGLLDRLTADEGGFLRAAKTMLPADTTRFVLVIDQFEELFSMVGDEDRRSLFIRSLLAAVNDEQSRISVIATLRADYFNRPLEYADLARVVEDGLVPVSPLSVEGLGRAVAGPARSVGLDLEPGLVSQIVADLEGQPGGLPLLQYALTEMFEARDSNVLTVETYRRIGGVAGALAGRAEALFNGLDAAGQDSVRQCFLRLVSVDADKNDLRRRVRRSELMALPVDQRSLEEAIRLFGASRLLSFDRDAETRGPTVEIAHEALPREWERLRNWIERQREDIVHHRALVAAVDEWRSSGRDEGYLLRGGRLDRFESWSAESSIRLTALESEFLDRSQEVRRAEVDAETRNRRRLKRLLAVAGGLAVVATGFGIAAFGNWQHAEDQSQRARSEALAAFATSSLQFDPELSMLLAIEALELSPDSRSAVEALNEAFQANRTVFQTTSPEFTGGSMSPDGTMIALSTPDELQVLPVAAPDEPTWTWRPPPDHIVVDSHFGVDGQAVVVGLALVDGRCAGDRWIVLDVGSGVAIADNSFPGLIPYFGGPAQNGPYLDLDRPMILGEGGADDCESNPEVGRVVAVDLLTGDQDELGEGISRNSSFGGIPSLSREGNTLAVGTGEEAKVIDLGSDRELIIPMGLTVLNDDGSLVLAGNNPLELWSVDEEEKLREFKADFRMAWFSPSEQMVYGATWDGRIMIFDIETADLLYELRGHQAAIRTVQMSDDERFIGSIADDGARVWDIGTPLLSTAGHAKISAVVGDSQGVFQTPDIHLAAEYVVAKRGVCADSTCDFTPERPTGPVYDQTTVYDLETGLEVSSYAGGLVAVAPNETVVALQLTGPPVRLSERDTNGDAEPGDYIPYGNVVIADLITGATIRELEGLCRWYTTGPARSDGDFESDECAGYPGPWREYVHFAAFSPDGSLLAMAGRTGRYAVWDVESGETIWTRDSPTGEDLDLLALHTNVAFSPDGRLLLVAQRRTVEVLEVGSFDLIAEFETDGGAPTAMEFNPGGNLLVINDALLNVHVIDTEAWERLHSLTGQQGFWFPDIAIDPGGRLVATAGLDNESRIWDVERGEEVQRFAASPLSEGLRNVEWVDDDTVLLGSRRSAAMMTLDSEVLLANARQRLTRSLTEQECATYGVDDCRPLEEMKAGSGP